MEEELSQEEQYRINRMFEMMQVPLLKYMIYLIEESGFGTPVNYSELFNCPPIEELSEIPIVLQNIKHLENKYIHISFNMENLEDIHIQEYEEVIKDQELWEFITSMVNNGANMIWDYFINESVVHEKNKEFLQKIRIELDLKNLTFIPSVIHPKQNLVLILQDMLKSLSQYKTEVDKNTGLLMYSMLPEEKKQEVENAEAKIKKDLLELEQSLSTEDYSECIEIEQKLLSMKRLSARCAIMEKEELPNDIQKLIC
jgi:hypothetical protein